MVYRITNTIASTCLNNCTLLRVFWDIGLELELRRARGRLLFCFKEKRGSGISTHEACIFCCIALIISFNVYTVVLILEVSIELEEPFIVENGIVDSECTSNILWEKLRETRAARFLIPLKKLRETRAGRFLDTHITRTTLKLHKGKVLADFAYILAFICLILRHPFCLAEDPTAVIHFESLQVLSMLEALYTTEIWLIYLEINLFLWCFIARSLAPLLQWIVIRHHWDVCIISNVMCCVMLEEIINQSFW